MQYNDEHLHGGIQANELQFRRRLGRSFTASNAGVDQNKFLIRK